MHPPLFLYALNDTQPGPIWPGWVSLGCGVSPALASASNEGGPVLHPPLFLYALNEMFSGPVITISGAGENLVDGVSGACPLRRGARIPTSARPVRAC